MEASSARGRSICEREQVVVVLDQLNSNVRDKTFVAWSVGGFLKGHAESCLSFGKDRSTLGEARV